MIIDNHGRPITYVRIAVTDRCNLRCFYCMPAEGIQYVPRAALLGFEEIERLLHILAPLGIKKVRLTGGEPFLRKDLPDLMRRIKAVPGIEELHMTTNGVLTEAYLPQLQELGISSVNLSLDSLDRERFKAITRRDELPRVLSCLNTLLQAGIPTKVNAVVMAGKNTEDLIPLAQLTRDQELGVRFIEEMPFNGTGQSAELAWDHRRILAHLRAHFPGLLKLKDQAHSTSFNYQVPGYQGTVGIIPAFSRTFCGACNRIRITATGSLKTCLYDEGVLDVKALLRSGATDKAIRTAFLHAFSHRAKDGIEAEQQRKSGQPVHESMSTIGG